MNQKYCCKDCGCAQGDYFSPDAVDNALDFLTDIILSPWTYLAMFLFFIIIHSLRKSLYRKNFIRATRPQKKTLSKSIKNHVKKGTVPHIPSAQQKKQTIPIFFSSQGKTTKLKPSKTIKQKLNAFLRTRPNIYAIMQKKRLFLIGGTIPCVYTDQEVSDIDLVSCKDDLQKLQAYIISTYNITCKIMGKKHQILTFNIDNIDVEISYTPHDIHVYQQSVDFTLAALVFNRERYLSMPGQTNPLAAKTISCMRKPQIIFTEDPLRLFRLVKYCQKYNKQPNKEIIKFLQNYPQDVTCTNPLTLYHTFRNMFFNGKGLLFYKKALELNVFQVFFAMTTASEKATPTERNIRIFLKDLTKQNSDNFPLIEQAFDYIDKHQLSLAPYNHEESAGILLQSVIAYYMRSQKNPFKRANDIFDAFKNIFNIPHKGAPEIHLNALTKALGFSDPNITEFFQSFSPETQQSFALS